MIGWLAVGRHLVKLLKSRSTRPEDGQRCLALNCQCEEPSTSWRLEKEAEACFGTSTNCFIAFALSCCVKLGPWFRPVTAKSGASPELLQQVELGLGMPLPADLRELLMRHDGLEGSFGPHGYIQLWSSSELKDANDGYEVESWAPGITLVGSDGGNEGIGFRTTPSGHEWVLVPLVGGGDPRDHVVVGPSIIEVFQHLGEFHVIDVNDQALLKRLVALAAAATSGPWISFVEGRNHTSGSSFIRTAGDDIELLGATSADQDFIAEARDWVPALVAEILRLQALANHR